MHVTAWRPTDLFLFCFQGVKKGQEQSDLERIQDLFPGDALRLYDKDALTMRMKGLMRKRSTTASKLQRALSAKRTEPEEQSLPKDGQDKRVFLLETPVQFTTVSVTYVEVSDGSGTGTSKISIYAFCVFFHSGSAKSREAPVSIQWLTSGGQGAFRWKFQVEGESSHIGNMDDQMLDGGRDRSSQKSRNVFCHRMAHYQCRGHVQVEKSKLLFFS